MQAETIGGETLERCEACGGEFCARQTLFRLVKAHTPPPGDPAKPYSRPSPLSDPVRYRKCPACAQIMSRKNFHDSSGIIVDVCFAHGVWFAKGELGLVFEFVETGALAKADRQNAERADASRQLDAFSRNLRDARPRRYVGEYGLTIEALGDIASLVLEID